MASLRSGSSQTGIDRLHCTSFIDLPSIGKSGTLSSVVVAGSSPVPTPDNSSDSDKTIIKSNFSRIFRKWRVCIIILS